jgi:hypothetical protein
MASHGLCHAMGGLGTSVPAHRNCHGPQKRATQTIAELLGAQDTRRLGGPVKPGHDKEGQNAVRTPPYTARPGRP